MAEGALVMAVVAIVVVVVIVVALLPSRDHMTPVRHRTNPPVASPPNVDEEPSPITVFNDTNFDHALFLSDGREYTVPAHGSTQVTNAAGLLATSNAYHPDGSITETQTPISRNVNALYLTYNGIKTDRQVEPDGKLINNSHMPIIFVTYSPEGRRESVKFVKPHCEAVHVLSRGSRWEVVHQAEEQTSLGDVTISGHPKGLIFDGYTLKVFR